MAIHDIEARLKRAEAALTRVAEGDFAQNIEIHGETDELTSLEMGINFMILDLREMATANAEKEDQLLRQQRELEAKLEKIQEQELAIRELSTPVMEIWDDILLLPVVGVVDTKRSMELMNNLLESIVATQSRSVILDITGVEVVDTKTADYLLKVVRAARLLGSECVLSGLSPAVAQTLVEIGADLTEVRTLRNLKAALSHCLARVRESREATVLDA